MSKQNYYAQNGVNRSLSIQDEDIIQMLFFTFD